ncbi:MBT domain-containing protein 1-like isoform X3 [Nematostella vectensis]|uniref:MBT domain-containing protein 1-like isoform X3 n=1 Tax=Nematostella vectensis TaxID=45351 RepID=UPI00207788CF|nr:MBT domain-containing protein 1-like isoform X3 [Nematostella vectensis]
MATAETLNDKAVTLTRDHDGASLTTEHPRPTEMECTDSLQTIDNPQVQTDSDKQQLDRESEGQMLAFYGEDESSTFETSETRPPSGGEMKASSDSAGSTLLPGVTQSPASMDTSMIQPTPETPMTREPQEPIPEEPKEEPLPENMAKCEFCSHIGERESFFSKSKRFCKMECAKRYSASNIKKKAKDKIGATKKKHTKPTSSTVTRSSTAPDTAKAMPSASTVMTPSPPPVPVEKSSMQGLGTVHIREVGESWQNKTFDWSDYLKKTGAKSVPAFMFKHVCMNPCLKGVHVGMKVEVVNCGMDVVDDTEVAFWVATVKQLRQHRVLLRYEGYEDDDSADFWFDLRSMNIHPVGWCAKRNKLLIPPPAIRENCTNWRDYLFKCLSGAKTFSAEFLQQLQDQPYNRFQKGMKVEVADRKNMYSMCVATIVDVIGDRLRLRYDGLEADVAEDFWCHYLSSEIHPIGWSSLVGHTLQPPIGWKHSLSKWNEFLADDLANSVDAPQEFFVQDSTGTAPGLHQFKVGMKFEAIDPFSPSHIVVVTVIKVLRFNYFVLGVDSLATYFVCHANSRNIFPCGWARSQSLPLTPPRVWHSSLISDYSPETFSWPEYLDKTGGIEAPVHLFKQERRMNGFRIGMKLEAVDLREPALVCPATVTDVKGPLLRIHFDGWDDSYDQLVDMDSLDIFPVSYCVSVGHPLQPPGPMPDKYVEKYGPELESAKQTPKRKPPPTGPQDDKGQKKKAKSLYPQETIYFNRKCYPGPNLNRELVRNLPDFVRGAVIGPEKHNIMRMCMQNLVSAALNPKQVLELFSREFYQNKKNKDLQLGGTVCIETKSKNGKRIMRRVRVVNKTDHLGPYLQRVCEVLNCCPEVVSATRYPMGYCSPLCMSRAKDNSVTSTSDGRLVVDPEDQTEQGVDVTEPLNPMDPVPDPSGELALPIKTERKDSPHEAMVTSTSNLPGTAEQDSDAASVLLYHSCNNSKDPRMWNMQDVANFMLSIGCSNYAEAFIKEEIDGKALLLLTQEMLESLTENKLGPMTKIHNAVRALKQSWGI